MRARPPTQQVQGVQGLQQPGTGTRARQGAGPGGKYTTAQRTIDGDGGDIAGSSAPGGGSCRFKCSRALNGLHMYALGEKTSHTRCSWGLAVGTELNLWTYIYNTATGAREMGGAHN